MTTPSDIRANYLAHKHGHFFDRDTMKFFGDTMRSFGVRVIDGVTYLYRKPSARVNVFGTWKTAGRAFFGAWRVDEHGDVHGVYDDVAKQAIYERVAR